VGRIGLIDREAVAASNLHRQILHATDALGHPKSLSAKARLEALNPDIRIEAVQENLDAANAARLLAPYDVIVDGSDNFPTRYLLNDACVLLGKPLVHGGVVRFQGQLMTILPGISACFRCIFPEPPGADDVPSCSEAGILGAVAGVIGTLMAQEALKCILGIGELLQDRLVVFDGLASRFREVSVRRNLECAVCGDNPTIRELAGLEDAYCGASSAGIRKPEAGLS
jgi:adenylyltransferase/sulfurtransferase